MSMMTTSCCAECGEEGGVSLKTCKPCMAVKYCNAACQMKHWPKHKIACKLRAAELREEALFKDPPAKEDCPICFLPMPSRLICCVSLPNATIFSVPIYDFSNEHEELARTTMKKYYPCCGKSICEGCSYSNVMSGNENRCPFCNSDRDSKTDEEMVEEIMKRVEANDAASINLLADSYENGLLGLQQDRAKAMELYARAIDLGNTEAHSGLGGIYHQRGDLKKAKFHFEAAAMAGDDVSRNNIGMMEVNLGNVERAVKHWAIAASCGDYNAMHQLTVFYEKGYVRRESIIVMLVVSKKGHVSRASINSTLTAYNNSCVEMRSEARDACVSDSKQK